MTTKIFFTNGTQREFPNAKKARQFVRNIGHSVREATKRNGNYHFPFAYDLNETEMAEVEAGLDSHAAKITGTITTNRPQSFPGTRWRTQGFVECYTRDQVKSIASEYLTRIPDSWTREQIAHKLADVLDDNSNSQ